MLGLKSCVLTLAAKFYRSMSLSSAVPCRTLPDQDYFALSSCCRWECGRLPTIDSFYPSIQATITLRFIDVAFLVIAVEAHTAPLTDVHVVKHRLRNFPWFSTNKAKPCNRHRLLWASIRWSRSTIELVFWNSSVHKLNSHLMDTASAQKLCRMKEPWPPFWIALPTPRPKIGFYFTDSDWCCEDVCFGSKLLEFTATPALVDIVINYKITKNTGMDNGKWKIILINMI